MAKKPADLNLNDDDVHPQLFMEPSRLQEFIELLPHPILPDFRGMAQEKKKRMIKNHFSDSEDLARAKDRIREEERKIFAELMLIDALYQALYHTAKADEAEQKFKETGNPLYAWHAFLACRPCRGVAQPLPDWVLEYLDGVAERVLATNKEYSAQAAEYMLGFRKTSADEYKGGGVGPVTQCLRSEKREAAIRLIKKRKLKNPKASIDSLCEQLVNEGFGEKWETIRKWYFTNKKKSG